VHTKEEKRAISKVEVKKREKRRNGKMVVGFC